MRLFLISFLFLLFSTPSFAQDTVNNVRIVKNGDRFEDEIRIDSAQIKTINYPYNLYNIELATGQILDVKIIAPKLHPLIEIGKIQGAEICYDCTIIYGEDGDILKGRYVSTKKQNIAIRIQTHSPKDLGKYQVEINVKNQKPNMIMPLKFGQVIKGQITPDDNINKFGYEFDRYEILLNKGQKVEINARSDEIDADIFIKSGKFEKGDGYSGEGENALLKFTAPFTGKYILDISGNQIEYGKYEISVGKPTIAKPILPLPIEIGKTYNFTLSPNDLTRPTETEKYLENIDKKSARYFYLPLKPDKKYWIEAKSKDFDINAELGNIDKDGNFQTDLKDDDSGIGADAIIFADKMAPEQSVLRITRTALPKSRAKYGQFEIFVHEALIEPAPQNLPEIKIGEIKNGFLHDGGPRKTLWQLYDAYKIQLKEGQRISAKVVSNSDFALKIGQGDPYSLNLLTQNDDSENSNNPFLRFRAPKDGEYIIQVYSPELMIGGQYSLKIEDVQSNTAPAPLPIQIGQKIDGILTQQSPTWDAKDLPYDLYYFDAIAGQTYIIEQNSDEIDTYLGIKEINATDFKNYDDFAPTNNSKIEWTAKIDGIVTLRASVFKANQYGKYNLLVTKK